MKTLMTILAAALFAMNISSAALADQHEGEAMEAATTEMDVAADEDAMTDETAAEGEEADGTEVEVEAEADDAGDDAGEEYMESEE